MRFLVTIHADANSKSNAPPNPELMAAIAKQGEEAFKSGKLVLAGGLGWGMPGTQIVVDGDKLAVTDGPYAETKELIAGFAIFEVPTKEEAVKLATDFMQLHRRILGPSYKGTSEVHQIFGGP
jgi:hypothetical protein